MPAHMRLSARNRVAACAGAGLATFGVAMALTPWQVAPLVGWDTMALAWGSWVGFSLLGKDSAETRRLATAEDDSRAAADAILLLASIASLIGVAFALVKAAGERGAGHGLITAVAAASVVVSWGAIHTLFTLRYARLYYAEGGGIDFHDNRQADFGDFAYVAFTVGMTYQVSDTDLVSKAIRMTALRHAMLSYLFGTAVVAMTINVVAGLLGR
ncbi:MAG TPA: DUF1345 domain-containing protein [Candidatus Dormibacteraeota bacterium]|nr:DUF1345 domain-containing protein [Candidatus Dormibacteraeota bacterium]